MATNIKQQYSILLCLLCVLETQIFVRNPAEQVPLSVLDVDIDYYTTSPSVFHFLSGDDDPLFRDIYFEETSLYVALYSIDIFHNI